MLEELGGKWLTPVEVVRVTASASDLDVLGNSSTQKSRARGDRLTIAAGNAGQAPRACLDARVLPLGLPEQGAAGAGSVSRAVQSGARRERHE